MEQWLKARIIYESFLTLYNLTSVQFLDVMYVLDIEFTLQYMEQTFRSELYIFTAKRKVF